MPEKLKLTVVDPDGVNPIQVGVPVNWTVDKLISDFVQKSGLPKKQGESLISYTATNKRTDTLLPADKIIKESDLQEGDTIRLRKSFTGLGM